MKKPEGIDELTDRERAREYLRGKLKEYVETITERDPAHRHFYKCPFCGNEEHKNSTAGAFSIAADKKRWKCFSCQKSGDIFDLIGYQYNYKSDKRTKTAKTEEYRQEYAKACEIFKLDPDFTPPQDQDTAQAAKEDSRTLQIQPATDTITDNRAGQFKEYLESCKAAMQGSKCYAYLIGRGFTPETIERFSLGYDSKKDLLTIPYSPAYSYYATRSIEGKSYDKPDTETAGPEPVFNAGALYGERSCFICESQLDAISIMQAGGVAAAVGGTGVEKLLKALDEKKTQHCLILCLDNDDAGRTAQTTAEERLDNSGIDFIDASFSLDLYPQPQKDSNDLLRGNAEQLAVDVEEIYKNAKEHELETGSGLYAVKDFAGLFKKHRQEFKQNIRTGFTSLDIALGGGLTNELYIMSAETGTGKSAIAACLAQNIAAQGIDVLYYALEMGRDEFIARGASMISKEQGTDPIMYGQILNDTYDSETDQFYRRPYSQYEKYVNEYMQRYGQHLYFIEGGLHGKTALEIAETVEHFKKIRKVKQLVIIVDYLQLLKADPEDRSQRDAMSIISAAVFTLKSLASQYGATIYAISSMSNAQKGSKVGDSSFKYSGDIGYTGGVLLGWNWQGVTDTSKEEDKEKAIQESKDHGYRTMILEVIKNRSGERDKKVTMFYYPQYNYIKAPNLDSGTVKPHRKGAGA